MEPKFIMFPFGYFYASIGDKESIVGHYAFMFGRKDKWGWKWERNLLGYEFLPSGDMLTRWNSGWKRLSPPKEDNHDHGQT